MASTFHSPYYDAHTQVILEQAAPREEGFDPQRAAVFLSGLAQESSLVLRLQACFPPVDPQHPDRPLRHTCPHPETIADGTADEGELLVLRTIKNQGDYLRRLAKTRGISKSKKMMDWLRGSSDIQLSQSSYQNGVNATRELMYAFCGILGYQYQEISDFFWKTVFQPPFKHKVWTEVVYSFFASQEFPAGQPQNNWYTASREFIDSLQAQMQAPLPPDAPKSELTEHIADAVWALVPGDTEALRDYLLQNRASFRKSNFNVTARQTIRTLYESCLPYAAQQMEQNKRTAANEDIPTARLFAVMLGEETAKNGLSPLWPKVIRKSFPTANLLGRILREEEALSDTLLRKMLLLLEFYLFYAERRQELCAITPLDRYDAAAGYNSHKDAATDYSGAFGEFLDDADRLLFECGFFGLYPRSPFDCLFILASSAPRPLEALRELLENGPAFLTNR